MNAVKEQLEALGAQVMLMCEKEFCRKAAVLERAYGWPRCRVAVGVDGFFSMARSKQALDVLGRIEEEGVLVVNSSLGVNRCIRRIMTERFIAGGIATPESRIIGRNGEMVKDIHYPCWLKRGDGCAQQKEDTCYVQNEQEAEALLKNFWLRGITSVVVNEHLKGDLIKFYGVSGTDFFYWFYPSKCGHRSKFGLEVINGDAQGIAFDADALKAEADKAADMLSVPVYGGDCVVGEDGSVKIIDFNDWPSFAPCRDEAAFYIATKMIQG